MPQNMWTSSDTPLSWGIYRNIPFALLGLLIIVLTFRSARQNNDREFRFLWLTIVLSFGFYIPVVLFAEAVPMIGMLMIPKTCAYVWTVLIGFSSMRNADKKRWFGEVKRKFCHVKKRTLLAIAGFVWLAAGFNVARLGIISYIRLSNVGILHILLSLAVFCEFGFMFFRMTVKHTRRINSYQQETRPFWNFFDLKAYLIMAFMMGGGIWLRNSGLAPDMFIAVFYTGLGCALALAGVLFLVKIFRKSA